MLCSKTLQTRLQAGGGELWDPLVDKIAAVAPCVKWAANEKNRRPIEVARRNELLAKPWLPLATLSTTCVQCRAVTVRSVHATYGVRICSGCCKKKVGLVVAQEVLQGPSFKIWNFARVDGSDRRDERFGAVSIDELHEVGPGQLLERHFSHR